MDNYIEAFQTLADPYIILLMIIGVLAGLIIGSLPGLTDPMALGLAIPFTFGMEPLAGILLLLAIHFGAIYGGSMTAILINTPGTPAGAAAALDGFPLTKKGHSKKALQMSALSALFAALVSVSALMLISPILAKVALKFGPAEYFALGIFGLSIVAGVAGKSLLKALIAATIGIFVSTIGADPLFGVERFTFGSYYLYEGIDLVTALIGLFALTEIFKRFQYPQQIDLNKINGNLNNKNKGLNRTEIKKSLKTMSKGSVIGVLVGALPGTGAVISSFLSYGEEVRSSEHPEKYGKGELNGVAAAESGAIGTESAAFIPLLTFGIPGDVATAILLGAFTLHGIKIGPDLFNGSSNLLLMIFMGILLLEIFVFLAGWYGSSLVTKIVKVPNAYLFPVITVLVVAGSFALMTSLFNVWVTLFFGFLGFVMIKFGYPLPPLLLGIILGPIIEHNYLLAISSTGGNIFEVISSPIALSILILAIIMMFLSFRMNKNIKRAIKK
ncbi:tripartite tricarboxylate transporter permease [Paraliobacillus salinarum]|uniref:tripartite tricarboxylate transporter permease n=1 Tax=Paraliobacillus salinarum TaxID=1158996 RepID=UPI0015F638A2|nr:tripartite tricarboxylate transporter permease [Paraliobacillus salinarum]